MFRQIQAIAMLSGTILGVGIFSLPFLLHTVGLLPMLILFCILGSVTLFLFRSVGHMISVSEGTHLIPGYIGMYLGSAGKFFAFFTSTLSLLFALLAYLIAGSIFLTNLFQGSLTLAPEWWAVGIFMLGGYFILRGAQTVARTELLFLAFFLLLFIMLVVFGIPAFHVSNLPAFYIDNPFLAFGGILFALWGLPVLPELKRLLGADDRRMKRVITISFMTIAIFTVLFMILIGGISGTGTTPDALTGLAGLLNQKALAVLYLIGFVAIFTSYMSLGVTLRDMLHHDFRFPWSMSFLIAAGLPFALYLIGITSLISVISIAGIVLLAGEGILLSLSMIKFLAQRREQWMHVQQFLHVLVILSLLIGAGLALSDFLFAKI